MFLKKVQEKKGKKRKWKTKKKNILPRKRF